MPTTCCIPTVPDPHEKVPELSRRARGVPAWAALAALGTDGLTALVGGLVEAARSLAVGLAGLPGVEVLNDVVYTQVSIAVTDDVTTGAVLDELLRERLIHPSGSRWHGRRVIRFSISNHATDAVAVAQTVDSVARAVAVVAAPGSGVAGLSVVSTSGTTAGNSAIPERMGHARSGEISSTNKP